MRGVLPLPLIRPVGIVSSLASLPIPGNYACPWRIRNETWRLKWTPNWNSSAGNGKEWMPLIVFRETGALYDALVLRWVSGVVTLHANEYNGSTQVLRPITTLSFSSGQTLTFTVNLHTKLLILEGATTGNGEHTTTGDRWCPNVLASMRVGDFTGSFSWGGPIGGTFGNLTLPVTTSGGGGPSDGVLQPGTFYLGVCGHLDQGGPYNPTSGIPYATQAAHMQNLFGSTPNTIIYRAFGDSRPFNLINGDITAFQALDIIPLLLAITYPPWGDFGNESAAYAWAYSTVEDLVAAAPAARLYEIGNEWNLQSPIFDQHLATGLDGTLASHWTSLASYPLMRGAAAGATRAIRDNAPAGTQIINGPTAGWIKLGFVKALADDLVNYGGVDLSWDFTCNHWYNGQFVNGFGLPDAINGGPNNSYALLKPAVAQPKPIIFTEFGASTGGGSNDATAAARITQLLDNFLAHKNGSGTELGVQAAIVFELYDTPSFPDYKLYSYSGGSSATIATQGTAVRNWRIANL